MDTTNWTTKQKLESVRTKSEPDKDKLLAAREQPDVADKFEKCGIYVDKDETFYVEPKKEDATA